MEKNVGSERRVYKALHILRLQRSFKTCLVLDSGLCKAHGRAASAEGGAGLSIQRRPRLGGVRLSVEAHEGVCGLFTREGHLPAAEGRKDCLKRLPFRADCRAAVPHEKVPRWLRAPLEHPVPRSVLRAPMDWVRKRRLLLDADVRLMHGPRPASAFAACVIVKRALQN